ncbi:MAG: hypothetical protein GTO18_14110 [Anaerolineales bacterium]|nr:hypothetical protein [Anaerolineales bacterium]
MTIAPIVIGYFIGSIPVAWIITKLVKKQDLRDLGSGNVGVMNVAFSVSRWAGLIVFLAEAAKGVLAVVIARYFIDSDLIIGMTVLATVAGTRWPLWLGFKGGRGNTAGAAALLLISWQSLLIGACLWVVIRLITRNHFVTTRTCIFLGPFILGFVTQSWWYFLTGVGLCLMYLTTHEKGTDDHLIIKENWPSLRDFLTSPRRK